MVTRQQVRVLIEAGHSYESAGRLLGVSPGLAYMVATGRPADGSDSLPPGPSGRPQPPGPSQRLANPEQAENPNDGKDTDSVRAWVRHRALVDTTMQQAALAAAAENNED